MELDGLINTVMKLIDIGIKLHSYFLSHSPDHEFLLGSILGV